MAMKEYLVSKTDFYSLRVALQDTYLSCKMDESVNEGKVVTTKNQEWV